MRPSTGFLSEDKDEKEDVMDDDFPSGRLIFLVPRLLIPSLALAGRF